MKLDIDAASPPGYLAATATEAGNVLFSVFGPRSVVLAAVASYFESVVADRDRA